MTKNIKPIETHYKGFLFRARLEARWAVYFDALGIEWDYEKEGYDLGEAGWYLPDFWLPQVNMWAEVKPIEFNESENEKAKALANMTHFPVLQLVGVPDYICYWAWEPIHIFKDEEIGNYLCQYVLGWVDYEHRFWSATDFDDVEHKGKTAYDWVRDGVNAARSARFEHGETPMFENRQSKKPKGLRQSLWDGQSEWNGQTIHPCVLNPPPCTHCHNQFKVSDLVWGENFDLMCKECYEDCYNNGDKVDWVRYTRNGLHFLRSNVFDNMTNMKPIEWLNPLGQPNVLFNPGVDIKSSKMIIITDDVLTSLSGFYHGLPIIGLMGIHAWKNKGSDHEGLLRELKECSHDKKFVLIYSSDVVKGHPGYNSYYRLAEQLYAYGAKEVRIFSLPILSSSEKTALNDFIVAKGDSVIPELNELIDKTIPYEPNGVWKDVSEL